MEREEKRKKKERKNMEVNKVEELGKKENERMKDDMKK